MCETKNILFHIEAKTINEEVKSTDHIATKQEIDQICYLLFEKLQIVKEIKVFSYFDKDKKEPTFYKTENKTFLMWWQDSKKVNCHENQNQKLSEYKQL